MGVYNCKGCFYDTGALTSKDRSLICFSCVDGSQYKRRNLYPEFEPRNDITVIIGDRAYRPRSWTHEETAYEGSRLDIEVDLGEGVPCVSTLLIKDVIFNPPATIVLWEDGKKTVVKTQNGEEFDPEKGLAMAIIKKKLGNQGNYFNHIKKWAKKYNATEKKEK